MEVNEGSAYRMK